MAVSGGAAKKADLFQQLAWYIAQHVLKRRKQIIVEGGMDDHIGLEEPLAQFGNTNIQATAGQGFVDTFEIYGPTKFDDSGTMCSVLTVVSKVNDTCPKVQTQIRGCESGIVDAAPWAVVCQRATQEVEMGQLATSPVRVHQGNATYMDNNVWVLEGEGNQYTYQIVYNDSQAADD